MRTYQPLEYGEELKLTMKDQTKRVVTIIHAREQGARVKELFHGVYDLDFDEVQFVHDGEDLHTPRWLKERGKAHVEKITGRKRKGMKNEVLYCRFTLFPWKSKSKNGCPGL